MTAEERSEHEVSRYVYACPCCGPAGRWGATFWGWALSAIGAVWLLGNLKVIPEDWWRVVIPLLVIAWGLGTLWAVRKSRDQA